MARQVKQSVFWDSDAPVLDPGDALVSIASRLHSTSQNLGDRLDEQMQEYDQRRQERDNGACECCGFAPAEELLDKQILESFKFCVKESASLFGMVAKLGLREREIALKEGQVALLVSALNTMMEAMGVSEAQAILGRQALIKRVAEIEASHGSDTPIDILDDVVDAELVPEPADLDWLA